MFTAVFILCFLQYLISSTHGRFTETLAKEFFGFFEAKGPRDRTNCENFYSAETSVCDRLSRTESSPFIVFILFKTSGHFLGMGSILDRKTILTADKAIAYTFRLPETMLVLAGCRSPWWAKNSQVRHVISVYVNEYEIALLEVNPEWKLTKTVYPVQMMTKLEKNLELVYEKELGVFGIATSEYFISGESMPKTTTYFFTASSCTEENDCGKDYSDLNPGFNDSVHSCLFTNGSYCSGCVGSPVVGLTKDSRIEVVGLVIRSSCLFYPRQRIMLKLYPFDTWIRSRSLLSYRLPKK